MFQGCCFPLCLKKLNFFKLGLLCILAEIHHTGEPPAPFLRVFVLWGMVCYLGHTAAEKE